MTRKVIVNGRAFEVVLDAGGDYRIGERTGNVSAVETEDGTWSLVVNGKCHTAYWSGSGQKLVVDGEGVTFEVVDPRSPGKRSGAAVADGRQTLQAAMPGKVVRILVTPGQSVEAGQGILVVEAMKMQNEVKSPKAGVVVQVQTSEGATVVAGQPLAVVE